MKQESGQPGSTPRAEGKHAGKACPDWLQAAGGRCEPIPERASVVRRIFSECIQGSGSGSIAEALNRGKVPVFSKRKGAPPAWTKIQIDHILRHKATYGARIKDGVETAGDYPAVIDEATFKAAGAALAGRRRTGGRSPGKTENAFTGLVFDGEDESRWSVVSMGGRKFLVNRERMEKGGRRKSFNYDSFEKAFIDQVWWLKSADIGDGDAGLVDALDGVKGAVKHGVRYPHGGSTTAWRRSLRAQIRRLVKKITVWHEQDDPEDRFSRRTLFVRVQLKGGVGLQYAITYAPTARNQPARHQHQVWLAGVEVAPWIGERQIVKTGSPVAHLTGKSVPQASTAGDRNEDRAGSR